MPAPTTVNLTDTVRRAVLADERRKRRNKHIDSIINLVFTWIGVALSGWFFMIAVGVARANWVHSLPTIRYGTAIILTTLLYGSAALQSVSKEIRKTNGRG